MAKRPAPLLQIPPPDLREVSFWVSKDERRKLAELAKDSGVAVGELGRAILNAYIMRWDSVEPEVQPVLKRLTKGSR